jgi:signal transduction histidine kinase
MKWFEPPVQSIRNPLFQTNLNDVIRFIVKHIFCRVSNHTDIYNFALDLDDNLPEVNINEFVVWEIFEPLIQNSIDHSGNQSDIIIAIKSDYDRENKIGRISIIDNGCGFPEELLERNEEGVKKIFIEHSSTKSNSRNSGYGCYIAYEISRQRCNWEIDAENLPARGCQVIITVPNLF